jgi:hypothetical protein
MVRKIDVQFTILNKENGILTKYIYLNDDGKVDKDSTQCFLSKGRAQVHQCAFSKFPSVLRSLHKNECIVHGVFDDQKYGDENGVVGIIKKDRKQNEYPDEDLIISRSLDYFFYPTSNAITMFDYDVEEGESVLSVSEYISIMSSMIQGFDRCAKVITSSTSSCIYDAKGTLLTGNKPSFHMYFPVKDSGDISRFKETLFKRCWLNGYGKIMTDKAKRIHIRTIFDASVFSAERLDFVAGAYCEDGLVQKLPDPEYYVGDVLDTTLLPSLTSEEETEYSRFLYQTKEPYLKEYEAHKEIRIQQVQKEKEWSEQKAQNYVNDMDDYTLWNDFVLHLDDGTDLTAKNLLKGGEKYDGVTMHDPFEPEQGGNKAKFFWNDGDNPKIHSFIRHRRTFSFKSDLFPGGKTKPVPTDKEPTFGGLDDFITRDESREKLEKYLKEFFGRSHLSQLLIMNAGLGKTRSFMKIFSDALQHCTKLYSIRTAYFVPDNDLSHELLQEYNDRQNLVGMPCMIRGRGHHNDHLKPPCKWAELYLKSDISKEEYGHKVSLLNAKFCKECRFINNCEYIQQFKHAESAHLIFFPHQYLFTMTTELKELVPTITHIVVDEDIVGSHVLNNTAGEGVFVCDRQNSDVAKVIIDDVEHGAEMKHVLYKWKDQVKEEYKKHRRVKEPVPVTNINELDNTDNINKLAAYKAAKYKRTFWKMLVKACEYLELIQDVSSVSVNNVWVSGNELKVCQKLEINSLWHSKKMLYLDASADPDIVQQALGKYFRVRQIRTHFHEDVVIKQMQDNLFTSSYLNKNYEKIFTSLKSYFDGNIPAFITTKAVENIVKEIGIIDPDTKSGHFKKIRGTDKFKDDEELMVIGRYLINGDALKEKARMLYPRTKEPLNFEYPHQEFVYRMKDSISGNNMAVMQRDYIIGSNVWKLNNHLSRSETEQAVARKRLFDVEEPVKTKTVYVLTSQVLDITVDELFPSSMFMHTVPRETGNEIQDAILTLMKSNGGVIRWKPQQISELTGIPTDRLNDTKKREWFIKNPYWQLMTVTYEKTGRRSRKSTVTDKLVVMRNTDLDEHIVHNLNPYEPVNHIKFAGRWS